MWTMICSEIFTIQKVECAKCHLVSLSFDTTPQRDRFVASDSIDIS